MDYASKNWVNYLFEKCKPTMGSNSYGKYTLYPDGRLHMTGWGFVTWTSGAQYKDATITLPYEMADKTECRPRGNSCGYKATDPADISDVSGHFAMMIDFTVLSTTQISVRVVYFTTIADTSRRLFTYDVWARWS